MNRVCFLIDGFNLYHSVKQSGKITKKPTKWLNINELCRSYLSQIGQGAELYDIFYFSALATHLVKNHDSLENSVVDRHKKFIACLKDTGIHVIMNRFKSKTIKCPKCHRKFIKHEEKETDVAIAVMLLDLFFTDECDTAVLVTGDTDIAPSVKTANKIFPKKKTMFMFPAYRKNKELSNLAPGSFTMNQKQYIKHQFPNPYLLKNGDKVLKPSTW